jgi:putative component of toxin-antitoxin plasmid stabilization module
VIEIRPKQMGDIVVILLAGGDKRSQRRDIDSARALARGLREG